MKPIYIALICVLFMSVVTSCDNKNEDVLEQNLELRAQALGFDSSIDYIQFVKNNCAHGNHENCNILANGEHRVCDNINHRGQHCNGHAYNGSDHKKCGHESHKCCPNNCECTDPNCPGNHKNCGSNCGNNGGHHGRN